VGEGAAEAGPRPARTHADGGVTLINGWDLLILKDGTALLLLHGERAGDPTPRIVPVGPLPAAEARRVADWLCRGGAMDTEEVRRHVKQLDGACRTAW